MIPSLTFDPILAGPLGHGDVVSEGAPHVLDGAPARVRGVLSRGQGVGGARRVQRLQPAEPGDVGHAQLRQLGVARHVQVQQLGQVAETQGTQFAVGQPQELESWTRSDNNRKRYKNQTSTKPQTTRKPNDVLWSNKGGSYQICVQLML